MPLGGLGEFGMNCMALRWGDDIIVIDGGLMFPEAELLGVDIVVPDISYLIENRQRVRGIHPRVSVPYIITTGRHARGRRTRRFEHIADERCLGVSPRKGNSLGITF